MSVYETSSGEYDPGRDGLDELEHGRAATTELTTDQVCWDLAPAPWPSSDSLLSLAVELLPEIEDEPTAVLVEGLVILVTERDEQVAAMRSVLSAELDERHRLRSETVRLRGRLIELREERQRTRAPMAATGSRPSPTAKEGN